MARSDARRRFPAGQPVNDRRRRLAVRMPFDVPVPPDRQYDVLALHLAVERGPIGLGLTTVPML